MSDTPSRDRFTILGIRDFRLLTGARFIWSLSQQIFNVAISLLIFDRTGSPLALGLIGLASFLPGLCLSLVSGPLADRVDRRRIAIVCFVIGCVATMGVALFGSALSIFWLYFAAALLGGSRAFAVPALTALLPNIVPKEQLAQAFAWNNSLSQIANISGPMFGGFLYAASPGTPFIAATVLLAATILGIVAIAPRPPQPGGRIDFEVLIAGYKFIWSRPVILGAISLDLVAVILGGATALLPIYAIDIFHAGPVALGVLRGANAVGALGAATAMAIWSIGGRTGRKMFICVFIFGLATVGFGLSTRLGPAILFLLALGAADQVSVVIRQMLVQLQTPDDMRGRVSAASSIIVDASNQIGQFESGVAARLLGTVASVVLGGVGSVIVAGLWIKWFPSLWKYDRLE
jgi:MFS family permease